MMRRFYLIILACMPLLFGSGCGFLHNPRVSRTYFEMATTDEVVCIGLWPVHVVLLPAAAVVDQTIHTFEIVPTAGRDAIDYFFLKGSGNNVMLEMTVFLPKTLATPLIFLGDYLARWFVPFSHNNRPFSIQAPEKDDLNEDENNRDKEKSPPPDGDNETPVEPKTVT